MLEEGKKEGETADEKVGRAGDEIRRSAEEQDDDDDRCESPGFEPIIYLPEVHVFTMEEDEDVMFKERVKLFRYEKSSEEWKARGIGDVKMLKHKFKGCIRILMRREKTLKICANHFILPNMKLFPHSSHPETTFIWSTPADFADETASPEIMAIKFKQVEQAVEFERKFNLAKSFIRDQQRSAAVSGGSTPAGDQTKYDDQTTGDDGAKKDQQDKAVGNMVNSVQTGMAHLEMTGDDGSGSKLCSSDGAAAGGDGRQVDVP